MKNDPPIEAIEHISQHPIYGIVTDYGRIFTQGQWYQYDPMHDRLVRSTKHDLFEEPSHESE